MMNILLSSVGRRNYLVSYFQEALKGKGKVLAIDADPNAPALQAADEAFVAPRFNDPNYLKFVLDICRMREVTLLISLNDLELPLLAREKESLREHGVTAVVSEPDFVDSCLDKWKAFHMLSRAGIDTPRTFNSLRDAQRALQMGPRS